MQKFKIIRIISICIIVIGVFLLININDNKFNNENNLNKDVNTNNINTSKEIILNMNCKDIENRYTYIENKNKVIIGNNIKEIENDFYDIFILNENNQILIKLNKLFIEYNEKSLYDEKYLNNILVYLNKLIGIDMDISILKDDIIKYYIKSKDIHNIEEFFKELIVGSYKITFSTKNCELIIIIKEK